MSLSSELDLQQSVLDLFGHPAWEHVTATISSQVAEHTNRVVDARPGTLDLETTAELRGQVRAFKWLLELPETTRIEIDHIKEQLQEQEEVDVGARNNL